MGKDAATDSGVLPMTPRSLQLLTRAIHLCLEYHAAFLATEDLRFGWGLCDAQVEIELLVREAV